MRWAVGLSAAAWVLIGAVVVTVRGRHEPTPSAPVKVADPRGRSELGRCRDLGEAAKEDAACQEAWAAARAHFFGEARP
ncbi:putative entry exclusion protein TrbK-alt [Caulobacter sp.]|uniref:putative entry exclusion protein TrbK-alt n=1 Tax=Caulobacter sp. TaxID=78 RepID=UPI0031D67848